MACIKNYCKCFWNTTHPPTRNCCSGFCLQGVGQTSGYCTVQNSTPSSTDSVTCPDDPKPAKSGDDSLVTYLPILLVALVIFIAGGIGWLYYRTRKLEKILSKKEQELFFSGDAEVVNFNGYAHENTDNLPYNKALEIPEADFVIEWNNPLGQGCYGLVLRGKIKNQVTVAIKTVRSSDLAAGAQHLRALLSEIKVLQYIGNGENIVSILGCNTTKLSEGKVFLFLEFCPFGSLEKHLRAHKRAFQQEEKRTAEKKAGGNTYVNVSTEENDTPGTCEISPNDLMLWSLQITNAMDFLAAKKVIHADLATRNVLLLRKNCVKITDFGLSRKLYDYGNYVKKSQEPLPWRWMALESLSQLSFSHCSDVWSLGITLWEIYSLGDIPYPGLTWTIDFVNNLENNLRPSKPFAAPKKIYDIMLDCWKPEPETRPTFKIIYDRLRESQSN